MEVIGVDNMRTKYGELSPNQIKEVKKSFRASIFFILLCIDPDTSSKYNDININQLFDNLLYKISAYNELLMYQKEIVDVLTSLESAKSEYNNDAYDFQRCRKFILDAGAEVQKIKEGGI